jgi:predicted GIY-YIG superfamily endonuclease
MTRVERGNKSHPYSLWLASQVVVLLSRTRRGADTYFWLANGKTREETAEALYDTLLITSPFRDYLTHILTQLVGRSNNRSQQQYTIDHSKSIFRPRDVSIPTHDLGYVYLLVSTRDMSTIYIGSTKNLPKRWRQHNSGFGAKQTRAIRLRPWAILAYIVGFDGRETLYREVENRWIAEKQDMIADHNVNVTVQTIHNKGKDIVQMYNNNNAACKLRFVSCGTIERASTQTGHVGGSFVDPPT